MENEKELRVLEAAKDVFLRYGFRRVTMQDVAEAAGISRPALYLIYPNKEEVFKAAVRNMTALSFAEIHAGLDGFSSVEERLRFTFEVWTIRTFALMLSSPDAKDLVNCIHEFARDTIQQINGEFEMLLVEVLTPLADGARVAGLTLKEVANLLAASIHGYKDAVTTVDELRAMIDGLIRLTMAGLRGAS